MLERSALPPEFNVEISSHRSGEVTQLCAGGGGGGGGGRRGEGAALYLPPTCLVVSENDRLNL